MRTEEITAFIEGKGGAEYFASQDIATNPRATAVAGIFLAKLLGKADDIPLEDLVTPASLDEFRGLLGDETRLSGVLPQLRAMGLVWPRVQPQPDGSVVVVLVPKPGNGTAPLNGATIGLRLRLVHAPDDWRVEWSF